MSTTKMIDSPEELAQLFEDYKLHVKSDPFIVVDYVGKDATPVNRMKEKPLSMDGFEVYVSKIPDKPWDLSHYFCNLDNRYKDYVAICSRIRKEIRDDQISGGMSGLFNPSITQRLNGLVDKTETKVIKEQPLFSDDPTDEEKDQ